MSRAGVTPSSSVLLRTENRELRTLLEVGSAAGDLLQLVLLHQVPEGTVGDSKQIGGFDLHTMGLSESGLQQRALDLGDIVFHVDAVGQHRARGNRRSRIGAGGSRARLGALGG